MLFANKLPAFISGSAVSIVLMLSCADDSPTPADAASCDCPLAEPPIGGRIVQTAYMVTLTASEPPYIGRGGGSAPCPQGGIVLSGGCEPMDATAHPDVTIEDFSPYSATSPFTNGWRCSWKNNTTQPVVMQVISRCLMPTGS